MRRAIVFTVLATLALPARAVARDDDDRPFGRGVILPSIALGGSFARGYGGRLLLGVGASYFVARGFAVGLHLRNVSTFYSQQFKEDLGGAFSQVPTNEFSLTPSAMWVFYRSPRFSPYIVGGVGPVFLNKKRGVLGEWHAGPGFLIGTGGALYIDLGILFSMRFTGERCERAYTFVDQGSGATFYNEYACSFMWGFRGGLVFGLGGRRERRQSPPPTYSNPPPSSYPPPEAPPPSVTSEPVAPSEPAPPPAEPDVAAPSGAAAPAPAAPPPTSAPPPAGESIPVPPPA